MLKRLLVVFGTLPAILSAQGVITTIAGGDQIPPVGSISAQSVYIPFVKSMAADGKGNVYVGDDLAKVIYRISPDGTASVIAGTGICAYSGDGGPARFASICSPEGLALDAEGNLYVADGGFGAVRRISTSGVITTVAFGPLGVSLDNVPALSERFTQLSGIAVGPGGRIYVSDVNRVIVIQDGTARFFAGTGSYDGYKGDGGPALSASIDPAGLATDAAGNLLIADTRNNAIRRVDANGVITSVVGGTLGPNQPQAFDPSIPNQVYNPHSVAVDAQGRICFTEIYSWVRCLGTDGVVSFLVSGAKNSIGYDGDGGPAAKANVNFPKSVAFDNEGNLYLADEANSAVRKVNAAGVISTIASTPDPNVDPQPALSALISTPTYLTVDPLGNVYFVDTDFDIVRHIFPDGRLETFVYSLKTVASGFQGVTVDSSGAVYVCDFYKNIVIRVFNDAASIFAGTGAHASDGDNGPALKASITNPVDLVFDSQGNLYIAEQSRIRRVAPDGTITTVAGNGKRDGKGDGVKAIEASVAPQRLAWHDGNLYFADGGALEVDAPQPLGDRIRVVTPDGLIRTIAGNGDPTHFVNGTLNDGGQATASPLGNVLGLAVDSAGRVHFSERLARVRMIAPDGTLRTVAGTKLLGFSGDGGPALDANLFGAQGIAFDPAGNLYISDEQNHRIRKVLVTPPTFTVDQKTLTFAANAGGAPDASQTVAVTASIPGVQFSITTSAAWLQASISQANFSTGATPCLVSITADPATLAAGKYSGTVTFSSSVGQPLSVSVAVTFTVGAGQPPQLLIDQDSATFTLPRSGGQQQQLLVLSNGGSGSFNFTATASTRTGGNWLSISPSSGSVTPRQAVSLSVTANVQGLAPGTYSGQIAIDAGAAGAKNIPATLTVSSVDQAMLLTQSGLSFTAVSGGGVGPSQSFGVKNLGTGTLSWTSSPSTTDGARWLSIGPSSGTSVAGAASPLASVSVDHRGLAPKRYYGLARVSAPDAANSPQAVTIHLDVLPPGSDPGAVIQPAELVFAAPLGVTPPAQEVFVYNLTATPLSFHASSSLPVGTVIIGVFSLSFLPYDGVVLPGVPFRLLVQPTSGPPKDSSGVLTLQFSNGKLSSIPLRVALVASAAASGSKAGRAVTACSPTKLIPSLSVIGQSFANVPAGWPSGLSVDVQDDCQRPITAGTVSVQFSNGDPPISLNSNGDGKWQGTWTVQHSAPSITLNVTATESQTNLTGASQGTASLQTTYDPPLVTRQGIVSTANPVSNQPLTPGGVISIYGQRLSSSTVPVSAPAGPLPLTLGDTTVVVGGRVVPLFYASESQLNGVVPWDLPTDTQQQLIIQRGVTLSDPIGVSVAQAQPAIYLYPQPDAPQQGLFVVIRQNGSSQTSFLNTPSAPARAGDTLVIYSLGMGTVSNQPDTGSPSPTNPLAQTPIAPVLRVGGRVVDVFFAGLSPGFVGLYQVQATLPSGIPTGPAVPVTIEIKGQLSAAVTLAIQ